MKYRAYDLSRKKIMYFRAVLSRNAWVNKSPMTRRSITHEMEKWIKCGCALCLEQLVAAGLASV